MEEKEEKSNACRRHRSHNTNFLVHKIVLEGVMREEKLERKQLEREYVVRESMWWSHQKSHQNRRR